MPQIEQIAATYASQIFWLLIVFGLIYFGIGRGMVPRIQGTVEKRDAQIADDLAAATRAGQEADATEEAWRTRMAEARQAALAETNAAKAKATADAAERAKAANAAMQARLDAAEVEVNQARASALASREDVAADAAQGIVAKLAGIEVSREAAADAVRKAVAHG